MNGKSFILLLLALLFSSRLYCQNCPLTYDKGTLINDTEPNIKKAVCYKREPSQDSIPGLYHTKYIVISTAGKELYNIHFYFYQLQDSLHILYVNATSGSSNTKDIKFDEHSSIRVFKNYKLNQTDISEVDQFCTLFSILDPTRPYVSLNRFQCMDEENVYLSLASLNTEKLQQHLLDVELYNKWKDSMNIVKVAEQKRIAERKKVIADFINNMKEAKDVVISKVKDDDNAAIKTMILEAPLEYVNDFNRKMDQFFLDYYKNIFPFQESNSELGFSFICAPDGMIDTLKTEIFGIASPRIPWFEDSFKIHIVPLIVQDKYRTVVTRRENPNLTSDFNLKYSGLFDQLSPEPNNQEFEEFLNIKKSLLTDLDKYLERSYMVSTKYRYSVKYRSTVEYSDWIYEINRKGVETIGPKGSTVPIPENLINIFKNKIAKPKIGKYRVKICSIYINDKLIGQDIQ